MPADDNRRSIHRLLVNRIRQGPGRAPAEQRVRAFDNAKLPEPLRPLLHKVATKSDQVTDADFATALEAGFTDDQLFELVICAAVGESTRQYEAGLAALAEAIADKGEGIVRPRVLDHGYGVGPKLLFRLIRLMSGHPAPDAAKITFYRPDFYGTHAKKFTQEAMRGCSTWSVGDRELMAAYVSKLNDSPFCIGAHTATAARAYQDGSKVAAVLAGLDSAPIEEGLRATLGMLGKLTNEGTLSADDIRAVLRAGVSHDQIEDALAVGFAFNTTDRLANAFGFEVLSQAGFEAGAKYLLKRGYR